MIDISGTDRPKRDRRFRRRIQGFSLLSRAFAATTRARTSAIVGRRARKQLGSFAKGFR